MKNVVASFVSVAVIGCRWVESSMRPSQHTLTHTITVSNGMIIYGIDTRRVVIRNIVSRFSLSIFSAAFVRSLFHLLQSNPIESRRHRFTFHTRMSLMFVVFFCYVDPHLPIHLRHTFTTSTYQNFLLASDLLSLFLCAFSISFAQQSNRRCLRFVKIRHNLSHINV